MNNSTCKPISERSNPNVSLRFEYHLFTPLRAAGQWQRQSNCLYPFSGWCRVSVAGSAIISKILRHMSFVRPRSVAFVMLWPAEDSSGYIPRLPVVHMSQPSASASANSMLFDCYSCSVAKLLIGDYAWLENHPDAVKTFFRQLKYFFYDLGGLFTPNPYRITL